MKKKIYELLGIAVAVAVVSVACRTEDMTAGTVYEMNSEQESPDGITQGEILGETEDAYLVKEEVPQIYVHVCGAVVSPGVYAMPEGSRLYEATALAGGLLDTADADGVNLAREARDGEQVRIPYIDEEEAADGLVNINSAELAELCNIPGVGEAKARAIISYREANGPFANIEELTGVNGIKEGLLEQMRPYIKCE